MKAFLAFFLFCPVLFADINDFNKEFKRLQAEAGIAECSCERVKEDFRWLQSKQMALPAGERDAALSALKEFTTGKAYKHCTKEGASNQIPNCGVCKHGTGKRALVVIDMQPYFAERDGNHEAGDNPKDIRDITAIQVRAIKQAIQAGMPIFIVEYDCGKCDPTNSELMRVVSGYSKLEVIQKDSDGMFDKWNKYRSDLVKTMRKLQIDSLVITGANGGACVYQSIRGALDNGCGVTAVTDGIADFNFEDFKYPYTYSNDSFLENSKFKQRALMSIDMRSPIESNELGTEQNVDP